jgi:hypothetical protein
MTNETAQWIDANGTVTDLDVTWDASGRFMPPIKFEEDGVPGQPGLRLRATRHDARPFTLNLWITAANDAVLRANMRALVYAMDPVRGPGKIRFATPAGDSREITCSYQDGLDMAEKLGTSSGPTVQRATVTFKAHQPYWSATSAISTTFTTGLVPNFFPIFPLRLSSSQVVVDNVVINNGDLESWPTMTINGPGSVIVLRNLTTGESMSFGTLVLGTGESVIVNTGPGYKSVVSGMGVNLFRYLTATSSLWSLAPGSNSIRLEMSGANSAFGSSITFSYRQQYLSV